jgi:hypothetical protein
VGHFAAMWSLPVDLGFAEVSFCSFFWLGGFVLGWIEGLVDAISNGFPGSWDSTAVNC